MLSESMRKYLEWERGLFNVWMCHRLSEGLTLLIQFVQWVSTALPANNCKHEEVCFGVNVEQVSRLLCGPCHWCVPSCRLVPVAWEKNKKTTALISAPVGLNLRDFYVSLSACQEPRAVWWGMLWRLSSWYQLHEWAVVKSAPEKEDFRDFGVQCIWRVGSCHLRGGGGGSNVFSQRLTLWSLCKCGGHLNAIVSAAEQL